jgi:biopolymer transport protein ExbD
MAEITQSGAQQSGGKVRTKKQSTKIDMTPMVDLAFLLLTFFILTTTFQKTNTMELTMPDNSTIAVQPIRDKDVLNLVLAEGNKVYWWIGLDPSAEITDYSKDGVRKLVLAQRRANPKLMVLIKPMDKAKYENMVDILDEMDITKTERYAIVNFTEDDKGRIR